MNPQPRTLSRSAKLTVRPVFSPVAITATPGQFTFTMSGTAGSNYLIQASFDLTNWVPLTTLEFLGDTLSFTDTNTGFSHRFYRMSAPQ